MREIKFPINHIILILSICVVLIFAIFALETKIKEENNTARTAMNKGYYQKIEGGVKLWVKK